MHCVNLRTDLHRPPFVSIGKPMPLSNPFPAGPDVPASAAEIAEAHDAAVAERDALQSQRTVFILDGTPEDVAEIDRRIALVAVRIEQLDAQHPLALAREQEEAAEHEAEQRRRKALHRQAVKASGEIAKLADEYVALARPLAALLAKVRERENLIEEANGQLPDGAEPVGPGEPHNGQPGVPSFPHYRLSRRVRLPALGPDRGFIWGEAPLPAEAFTHGN